MKRFTIALLLPVALLMGWLFFKSPQSSTETLLTQKKKKSPPIPLKEKKKRLKAQLPFDVIPEAGHPDLFFAYHDQIRRAWNETRSSYAPDYLFAALEDARKRPAARLEEITFTERGPSNIAGRIRGVLIDPADPENIWYAASVSGGIWKTTNAGADWTELTPNLPNLAFTWLASSAANPDVIYGTTGETIFSNLDAVSGAGIFKSTDRGQTWTQLPATVSNPDLRNGGRVIVSPADANELVVAGYNRDDFSGVIHRSTDGGQTWTRTYRIENAAIQQVIAAPSDFSIQYATARGKAVLKSTDAGRTWTEITNQRTEFRRIELAIGNDPNVVYASAEGSPNKLYRSTDGGQNWQLLVDGSLENSFDFLGAQGWYDNTVMVHPFNDNIAYIGGIGLWQVEATGQDLGQTPIRTLEEDGTRDFITIVNLFFDEGTNLSDADKRTSIEIRFGNGRSQKAHRFVACGGNFGAGCQPNGYAYADYVDVPFEVWDVTNNRQLMVSFRDNANNGAFTLTENTDESRDYIFPNLVDYDPNAPAPQIAQTAGAYYRSPILIWLRTPDGQDWNPAALPESRLRFVSSVIATQNRQTTVVSDPYRAINGQNASVHPDHHNLLAIPTDGNNFRILNANDGGIYLSRAEANPGVGPNVWEARNTNLNITQFYGADKRPGFEEYLGGTQDNGAMKTPLGQTSAAETGYQQLPSGDGFEVVWHPDGQQFLYTGQFNFIVKSSDPAGNNLAFSANRLDPNGDPFVTRLAESDADPELIFAIGGSGVWRSLDFGSSWKLTPIAGGNFTSGDVAISDANPQIVWAGRAMGGDNAPFLSEDGGLTFRKVSKFGDIGNISGIYTHPFDEGTAYMLFSANNQPKILRTQNKGQSWQNLTGPTSGFPNVATYALLVMPHAPETLWAGTEIGIFVSTNNGQSWSIIEEFPKVSVWDFKIQDDQVVIATHGRGIWTATIPELLNAPKATPAIVPLIASAAQAGTNSAAGNPQARIQMRLRSAYDRTEILGNGQVLGTIPANATAIDQEQLLELDPETRTLNVQLRSFVGANVYLSNEVSVQITNIRPAVLTYKTDFDNPESIANDFSLGVVGRNGIIPDLNFSVRQVSGFASPALHTDHPYAEASTFGEESLDYVATLNVPIIVHSTFTLVEFDNIAIVEKGEPGTRFGDPEFWDYVVVEGSYDLNQWIPLEAGYDASTDAAWSGAIDAGRAGTPAMYRTKRMNLRRIFDVGDTVFLRFRLFSDPLANGWGWAIDNLKIQDGATDEDEVPTGLEEYLTDGRLGLFPNPSQRAATLEMQFRELPEALTVALTDMSGRTISRQELRPQSLNWQHRIPTQNLPAGMYLVRVQIGDKSQAIKLVVER